MEIRRIAKEERFEALEISATAFHFRIDDPEKARADAEMSESEDWGAFDAEGRMAAHIINNHFVSYIDGNEVRNGGIGAVSTLPEYRDEGCIRQIFASLLPEARAAGEVISTLYPFNHAFYRKVGYETCAATSVYEFAPEVLRTGYRCKGSVKPAAESDIPLLTGIYSAFAVNYNFALLRDEANFRRRLGDCSLRTGKFAYLLEDAYLFLEDTKTGTLKVTDCAWSTPAGFREMLGFLARFTADYSLIILTLPEGVELINLIHSPKAYDIKKVLQSGYMCRVMNTEKLLFAIRHPEGVRFNIKVTDDLLPENSGTWRVTEKCVQRTDAEPDIEVDVRALAQLATGAVSLAEAGLRDDVKINSNIKALEKVFVRKPLYIGDHF